MAEAMSKSAKKRAAKKARDEAGPPADAAPKAAPKPKAEPKAKAAAAAAVPAPEPKAQPKAKVEAKAKAKKKSEPEVAPPPKPKSDLDPLYAIEMDDGTGGDWATSTGKSKKDERRQQKKIEREKEEARLRQEEQKQANAAKGGSTFAATQIQYGGMSETQKVIASARATASKEVTVKQDGAKAEAEEKKTSQSSASVHVPEERTGIVIGEKGKNLKMITEKTGVARIDTEGQNFVVVGEPASVAKAEIAIRELVEKGYCSLAYDDFEAAEVMAYPQSFPDIIGKNGAIIQKLKKELGVEISIPKVPPKGAAYKKYPVGIAGSNEQVKRAKEALESIIMYYHHPITHEGVDHLELEIESYNYSYIIGKQGSELKHIQNNFNVRVYIPREHSINSNVVVVGSKLDCERTKTYIEKVIAKASEPRGRGAPDKADDHFGPEEDEEPWMAQYMYKRKK